MIKNKDEEKTMICPQPGCSKLITQLWEENVDGKKKVFIACNDNHVFEVLEVKKVN